MNVVLLLLCSEIHDFVECREVYFMLLGGVLGIVWKNVFFFPWVQCLIAHEQFIKIINSSPDQKLIMYSKYLNSSTSKTFEKLVPNLIQIGTARIVNFLTMNISHDGKQWTISPNSHLHKDHILAQAYMQMNFKNQIMDLNGMFKMDEVIKYLSQHNKYSGALKYLVQRQLLQSHRRKNLYILCDYFNEEDIQQSILMNESKINKILCFSREKSLVFSNRLQKFFLEKNIKVLPLEIGSLQSVFRYVLKKDLMPVLLHEMLDKSIYQNHKNMPKEIIIFCNLVEKIEKNEQNPFISFADFTKNYYYRQNQEQNSIGKDFTVKRFMEIKYAKKNFKSFAYEEGILNQNDLV